MIHFCASPGCRPPSWMRPVLITAGIYSLLFAAGAILWSGPWCRWCGMEPSHYPMLWQAVGLLDGVFGLGYLIASSNPIRHWALLLLGFVAKVLVPIGFAVAISRGFLPLSTGWIIVASDLIWWIPFALILWVIVQAYAGRPPARVAPYSLEEAATHYKLDGGQTLLEASREQTLILVFLRHFGCTFTRQILSHLQDLEREAAQHGGRLVLVHMLQRGDEKPYVRSGQVERIADPYCELYRSFGLGKGGFWELFGPTVWIKGFRAFFSGCGVGHLAGDGLQMPGAFLFRNGRILAARPARNAAELPDIHRLFEAATQGN